MIKTKILKGDVVRVTSGNHKGKQGPVTKILKIKNRVFVEGITGIKHVKPSQSDDGGIKEIPISIHMSNVAIIDPKNKENVSRIGYKITDGKKIRVAKKSSATIK